MAKHNSIPIWSIDRTKILYHRDPDTASGMRLEKHHDGTLKYIYRREWVHGKGIKEELQLTPTPRIYKSSQDHSPCSITPSESRLNAFLKAKPMICPEHSTDCPEGISNCEAAQFYKDARDKVNNYDPTAMRRELYTCPA